MQALRRPFAWRKKWRGRWSDLPISFQRDISNPGKKPPYGRFRVFLSYRENVL